MICKIIADFLVFLHFNFILFVVGGGVFALKYRRLIFLHTPAVIWAALLEFNAWICPLTVWENHYRRLAGEAGYEGGFIQQYLLPIIYPTGLTADVQWILGLGVIGVNVLIYGFIVRSVFR